MTVGESFGADQIAPEIGAQMRGVEAAEDAVPVGVVALGAKEIIASFEEFRGGRRIGATLRNIGDPRRDAEHFLIEEIGFGIY